jgi:hypothetical protein
MGQNVVIEYRKAVDYLYTLTGFAASYSALRLFRCFSMSARACPTHDECAQFPLTGRWITTARSVARARTYVPLE